MHDPLIEKTTANLLVNFGGPRDLNEVAPFLTELLCDQDVVRTQFPKWLHRWMFKRVARKRTFKVSEDYQLIGGKSPIYFDTESIASSLRLKLKAPVLTFHRYLPATHQESIEKIEECDAQIIHVFPMFPQFCYATTGSIARFFQSSLSVRTLRKLRWVKSYAAHPSFIAAQQRKILDFLTEKNLKKEEIAFIFSAHGIPVSFVQTGDPYEFECELSFSSCMKAFPGILGKLSYQSKFGSGKWLEPPTDETCKNILEWHQEKKHIVLVPISFTSDHIETLFEIETLYLPLVQEKGLQAYRCPALNCEPYWIDAIAEILQEPNWCSNELLVRGNLKYAKST